MEFVEETVKIGTTENASQSGGSTVLPFNKKSTVCGDCTVVEDIDKIVTAPIDRLLVPGDIVELREDDESIYIIGTREGKVTKIRGLEVTKKLKVR